MGCYRAEKIPNVPSSPPQPQQSKVQQKANHFPCCLLSAYSRPSPPAPLAATLAELPPVRFAISEDLLRNTPSSRWGPCWE